MLAYSCLYFNLFFLKFTHIPFIRFCIILRMSERDFMNLFMKAAFEKTRNLVYKTIELQILIEGNIKDIGFLVCFVIDVNL